MNKMTPRDELLKEIEKIPEFELLKVSVIRDETYRDQTKFKAVVERGKDEAIAMVSSRYALVQMREIFERVLSRLEDNVTGKVVYYRGRGQLHVFPEGSDVGLCALNSVDGSSAIKVFFVREVNGVTMYLPRVREYKRLHVGTPLDKVVNFAEILLDAQEAWKTIVERLAKVPLTDELVEEVKQGLDTKTLVEVVDQFTGNSLDRYAGKSPTLWDLLLVVLKAAAGSKFKSEIHRERRLRQLSCMLLAYAFKQ